MGDEEEHRFYLPQDIDWALAQRGMEFLQRVGQVAGFHVEEAQLRAFRTAHCWIVQRPRSPGLRRLKPNAPGKRDWLNLMSNGLLTHTQQAFRGVLYRLAVLESIENEIHSLAESTGIASQFAGGRTSIGGGDTLRIDCEYQDLLMGIRRTLDYLARALGAYFKKECWSFRTIVDELNGWEPADVAARLHAKIVKPGRSFDDYLSSGDKKTVRDRIAHREFVSAGTLNVTPMGVMIAGEESRDPGRRLLPILEARVQDLRSLVSDAIDGLVDADRGAFPQPHPDHLHDFDLSSPVDARLRQRIVGRRTGMSPDMPIISRGGSAGQAWHCQICGWESDTWEMGCTEFDPRFERAEEQGCLHMRSHRQEERGHVEEVARAIQQADED